MIKRIIVVPRRQIESVLVGTQWSDLPDNWALISIYEDLELLTFQNIDALKLISCKKTLSLKFADITKDQYDSFPENLKRTMDLFNEKHANWIINFLNDMKDEVDTLVIHCAAGISRSGAVGLFACRYLGLDETEFRKNNVLPNFFVIDVLNKVSNFNGDYVDWWKKRADEWGKIDHGIIFT